LLLQALLAETVSSAPGSVPTDISLTTIFDAIYVRGQMPMGEQNMKVQHFRTYIAAHNYFIYIYQHFIMVKYVVW
jgi:hypothetical protein